MLTLATAASGQTLPRSGVDRSDDLSGAQIHVTYVLPGDGADRELDVNGTLTRSVQAIQAWLRRETGGRSLAVDTSGGLFDITFYRLSRPDAEIKGYGVFVRDQIEAELRAAGQLAPGKIYAVYYDGGSTVSCGGGAWPPDLPGQVGAMYLQGTPPGAPACSTNAIGADPNLPGYIEYGMVHEILHTLGFVAACAPNHTRRGHVSTPNNDLMWAGDGFWSFPASLDVGHDDYYGHGRADCPDFANSPYLTGTSVLTGNGLAQPSVQNAGGPVRLTVAVVPGTSPPSTGLSVVVDATGIGGASTLALVDDGAAGCDALANDLTFTACASIDPRTTAGAKNLPAVVRDAEGRVAQGAIALSVFPFVDTDSDGLPDLWETQFGLGVASAAGDDGAAGDPDGDGLTNMQEFNAGTHPRGLHQRYLAEGALNAFFDTRLALLNVGSATAHVQARFLQSGGITSAIVETLAPLRRLTLARAQLASVLSNPDFSTVVESDQPMVVDRTMSWDATGYGSHAETAVAAPSTTWYLAEGSTSGEFSLFYLLENPNPVATTATVRYLLPLGQPPIERQYALAASSRTTIPVDDQGPAFVTTDVSAMITASLPIIAERAMYLSRPGQPFAAGHGSAGVTAPATSWFLAEGATGPFFDMFILLANPTAQAAAVRIDYLLSTGTTLAKTYTVPANGRFTVWVDDEQIPLGSGVKPLDNVAVSSAITSTNGVPIVVERTMWWPSPALTASYWTEAHNAPGATATGTRWALAEGETGGANGAETYILIANTSAFAGDARVTLYFEDGTSAERTVTLVARSRTSVRVSSTFPESVGKRYASVIESLGATPAQIVVERAMYTSPGGQVWAAGTNALAARLP